MKITKPLILSLIISAICTTTTTQAAQQRDFSGAPSADGKSFIYYSYRNGALPDLYVNTLDGKEQQITNTEEFWEIEPDWSADGKLIAYAGGESMGDLEIYLAKPDGSHVRQLTDDKLVNSGPHFSPDGKSLIFNRMDRSNDSSSIVSINLKTGAETVLMAENSLSGFKPKFSPDGTYIAFLGKLKGDKKNDLYIMKADGSHRSKLTIADISVGMIDWAKSEEILLTGAKEGGNSLLYSYNLHQKNIKQIAVNDDDHVYFISSTDQGKTLFFDAGDWSTNFFVHKGELNHGKLTAKRVSGDNFLNHQQELLDTYLAPFVGRWVGTETEGRSKGHFREETVYSWGPNKTSLNVEMKMFWDDEPMGSARGYMALDRDNNKAYFNLVMQDGTVVMQEQSNAGNAKEMKMTAKASGDGSTFPHEFKTELVKIDKDNWKSYMFRNVKGEWQRTFVHEFSRVQ